MKQSRYTVTNNVFSKVRVDDEIKLTDETDSVWIPKKYFMEDDWNYNKKVISRNDIYKNIKPDIGVQYVELHSINEENIHEAEFFNPIDNKWHSLYLLENIPNEMRDKILPIFNHTSVIFRKKVTIQDNEILLTKMSPEYNSNIFVWIKDQWVNIDLLMKYDISLAKMFNDGYLFKEIKQEEPEKEEIEELNPNIDVMNNPSEYEIQVGTYWYPIISEDDEVKYVNVKGGVNLKT